MDPFAPPFWSRGGHRQTLLGVLARRSLVWNLPTEDLFVQSGEARLLVRASFQPGSRDLSPGLLLVHGLAGSDASSNVVATGLLAFSLGYHVLRMNMRGAGDSLPFCPLLYNAGLDQDLVAVLTTLAAQLPKIFLAGFSLGGNLVLLALGRRREALPRALVAAGAVSPPVNLLASTRAIARRRNVFYEAHFVRELREGYRARQRLRPDLFEAGRESRANSIYLYDDLITAPYGGYESAEDYYARSSAGPWLSSVKTASLVLAAEDDPMIPVSSLLEYPLPPSGLVHREILKTGGHVGYFAGTRAPGHFWAAERLLGFFASQ